MATLPVHVALCVDRNILPGLHVTLRSAFESTPQTVDVVVHILHEELTEHDFELLRRTLFGAGPSFRILPLKFDFALMPKVRVSNVGSAMTFARLWLPDLLPDVERVIYLDADLVVRVNLAEMWIEETKAAPLAGVSRSPLSQTNDSTFLQGMGLPPDFPYINAGVLLMNLKGWREGNLVAKCRDYLAENAQSVPSGDQTVLNYVFHDRMAYLPTRYNLPLNPTQASITSEQYVPGKVYHLIGRPKPWEPGGTWLNAQSHIFQEVYTRTALADPAGDVMLPAFSARRSIRMWHGYAKCVIARVKERLIRTLQTR